MEGLECTTAASTFHLVETRSLTKLETGSSENLLSTGPQPRTSTSVLAESSFKNAAAKAV